MKRIVFFVILILPFFYSCNSRQEIDELKKRIITLEDSLRSTQNELIGYKYTPSKLIAMAKLSYERDDLAGLDEIRLNFKKYHPESNEIKNVESLRLNLVAQREKAAQDKKQKEMTAVTRLKKKYDDVSGITWYYNPYFTHYNNSNLASLYIGKDDSKVWLRLVMSYYGEDWIFFKSAYLSYDGHTREIYFDEYSEKQTDNDSSVWEWIDISVDSSLIVYLKEFSKSKSPKMRLSGKYTHTRNLSAKEIKGIQDVLLAYDVLVKQKK